MISWTNPLLNNKLRSWEILWIHQLCYAFTFCFISSIINIHLQRLVCPFFTLFQPFTLSFHSSVWCLSFVNRLCHKDVWCLSFVNRRVKPEHLMLLYQQWIFENNIINSECVTPKGRESILPTHDQQVNKKIKPVHGWLDWSVGEDPPVCRTRPL